VPLFDGDGVQFGLYAAPRGTDFQDVVGGSLRAGNRDRQFFFSLPDRR
jgi:hypothetical protein